MNYPMEKYTYYVAGDKVVAVTTYAGKRVRAVAKRNPEDEFNLEIGKKLAALRCNAKVCEKRVKRATRKYLDAVKSFNEAKDYLNRMREYSEESSIEYKDALKELYEFTHNN